mgnify:CR=1 FL=1
MSSPRFWSDSISDHLNNLINLCFAELSNLEKNYFSSFIEDDHRRALWS